MIDRIEELLGHMAAEDEEDERPDALTLLGAAAAAAAPRDRDAAEEIQAREGSGASKEVPDGPDAPDIPEDEEDLSGLEEFGLPAPLLSPPERADSGAGDGPSLQTAGPVDFSDGPAAPEPSLAGLEELYRETARETLPSAAPAIPQGGRGEFARRAEEPGSAASLAVDELDRAVRRDSRRYDGEMSIY